MSKENLNQFSLLVLDDLSLQNQLKILMDRNDFIVRVIELGADNGFEISREDIEFSCVKIELYGMKDGYEK